MLLSHWDLCWLSQTIWSAQCQDHEVDRSSWKKEAGAFHPPPKLLQLLRDLTACQALMRWLFCHLQKLFLRPLLNALLQTALYFILISPWISSWLWPCRPPASPCREQAAKEGKLSLPRGAKGHFSKPYTWSHPDRALLHIYWVLCWILLAFALTSHPHHFFISYFRSPQTTPSTSIQTLWECLFWAWTTDIYVGGEMNQSFALTQKSTPFLKRCFGLHANYSEICKFGFLNNLMWSHIYILLNVPSHCKWRWPDISNTVNTGIYY